MRKGYVDFHVHPIEKLITPEQLIDEMNRSNVQKAVLLALDIDKSYLFEKKIEKKFRTNLANSMVWDIESQYQLALNILEVGRTENSYVAGLVKRYPDRFIGFGSVNPRKSKKLVKEEVNRVKELDLKGIKLIPTLQFFDPEKNKNVKLLWKLSNDNGLIILYHTGCDPGPWEYLGLCDAGRPVKIVKLISQFETPVVLAHAGAYSAEKPGIWLNEAVSIANKYEHVWLDTSSVPYILHNEDIVNLFRDNGIIEKVLFGSDYPVVQGLDMSRAVALIELSPYLSEREKILILRENALRLLSKKI